MESYFPLGLGDGLAVVVAEIIVPVDFSNAWFAWEAKVSASMTATCDPDQELTEIFRCVKDGFLLVEGWLLLVSLHACVAAAQRLSNAFHLGGRDAKNGGEAHGRCQGDCQEVAFHHELYMYRMYVCISVYISVYIYTF
jgi:hypothetical protein